MGFPPEVGDPTWARSQHWRASSVWSPLTSWTEGSRCSTERSWMLCVTERFGRQPARFRACPRRRGGWFWGSCGSSEAQTILVLARIQEGLLSRGAQACALSPPTGVHIPLIFTERRISGTPVGSPFRRTGRSPPGPGRSGACKSRCILPLRTGVSTPGRARDPDP
jgi:hypothetical protein